MSETNEQKNIRMIRKIGEFLFKTLTSNKPTVIYGGAGSGKSYNIALFLVTLYILSVEPFRVLITRKTNSSLTLTAYKLVEQILKDLGIKYEHIKSEQIIRFEDGTEFYFRGIDDPEKIKSSEFNIAWLEEGTDFDEQDYLQIKLRLRRPPFRIRNLNNEIISVPNKIILSFNPVSLYNWVYPRFFERNAKEKADILHTNFLDNPYLPPEYRDELERLKETDPLLYRIYTLGEFAETVNTIYTNYRIIDESEVPDDFEEIFYGVDFGYNNPTAVLKIGKLGKSFYIIDEIYEIKMTNEDLIERLKSFVENKDDVVYCDSAEPQRIEELRNAGFLVIPAAKSVKDGIDFIKRLNLYISNKCSSTIKEIKLYKWKEDKNGAILDEPVKHFDHAMDAMRYAIYTSQSGRLKMTSTKVRT